MIKVIFLADMRPIREPGAGKTGISSGS